jgi:hypothetical protein
MEVLMRILLAFVLVALSHQVFAQQKIQPPGDQVNTETSKSPMPSTVPVPPTPVAPPERVVIPDAFNSDIPKTPQEGGGGCNKRLTDDCKAPSGASMPQTK